jgi:hypothetical protein
MPEREEPGIWSDFVTSVTEAAPDVGRRAYDLFTGYNLDDNTLGQSEYDFRYRVFPEDIGNSAVGHYMIINVNVPVLATGDTPRARSAYTGQFFRQTLFPGQGEASKVDTLRFGKAELIYGAGGTTVGVERDPFSVPRYTRRIKESIAIFMPTPMVYTTRNEYQEISLTALAGGAVVGTAGLVAGAAGSLFGGETGGKFLGSLVTGSLEKFGSVAGLVGYPINPRVEVIFSRTSLREFRFEFLMAPRNERESFAMEEIVRTLRLHSVPELDQVTRGFTYVPPAEFDFTFFNKGTETVKVPRINTCVMDAIEVDYAPTGVYSTFSNGYPVAARLSLGVREIEPLHKRRILQGF